MPSQVEHVPGVGGQVIEFDVGTEDLKLNCQSHHHTDNFEILKSGGDKFSNHIAKVRGTTEGQDAYILLSRDQLIEMLKWINRRLDETAP